jgi:Mobilization protein NikA
MARGHATKTRRIALRMPLADADALREQALECALTMSELIRRRITGQPVVSRTDHETARSIDQLGRMLKHLYPRGQAWANPEDRKRWWTLVTELECTAKALRALPPGAP